MVEPDLNNIIEDIQQLSFLNTGFIFKWYDK